MIACAALVLSLLALPTGASTIFLVPLLGALGWSELAGIRSGCFKSAKMHPETQWQRP